MRFAERERTTRLADAVLKHLGLGPDQLDALQALPLERLQEAVAPAQATLPRPRYPLLDRYNFGPVIDGSVLPGQPFDPAAPSVSADVPILIGGTKDESAIFLAPDDAVWNRTVTEDDLRKRIAAVAGDAADSLLAYYKRRDPAASPSDRLITALTASNFGVRSVLLAERKAARRQGARLDVQLRLGDAGVRRAAEVAAFRRRSVRLRYARVIGEAHRTPQRPGAGRPRLEDVGHLRAQRRSRQRSDPGVAGLYRRAARHDASRR